MRRFIHNAGAEDGFNLFEVTLALFVLSVGLVSVLAVFPAAFTLQRDMVMDSRGSVVAKSAAAFLAGEGNGDCPDGVATYILNHQDMDDQNCFIYPDPTRSGNAPVPYSGVRGSDPLMDGMPVRPGSMNELDNTLGPDNRFYWRAVMWRPPNAPPGIRRTVLHSRVDVWFDPDPGNAASTPIRVACYHSMVRAK
jgi:hypothetical protein